MLDYVTSGQLIQADRAGDSFRPVEIENLD